MISVDEALSRVLDRATPKAGVKTQLAEALGLVLSEDVASDVDSPPYDKSIVDGYAIVAKDLASGEATLQVIEQVMAGAVPKRQVTSGQATRIMTGAPLPAGADTIVMVERTQFFADRGALGEVEVRAPGTKPGQNIMRQATSLKRGEVVLHARQLLRPIEIGLLAEVGHAEVKVIPAPTVAVLATGNELVPLDRVPGPGQIRNSNGPMLMAAVARAGGRPRDLGIGRDDRTELAALIRQGLESDVLVLSGGVSAGLLDLVPEILIDLGVEQLFHKVQLKPGKPLWFGCYPSTPRAKLGKPQGKLVFGLPGNPVSTLVCFELFVRPALGGLAGRDTRPAPPLKVPLASRFKHRGDRPTWFPAELTNGESREVVPLDWHGSADLKCLGSANALIHFPAGDREFARGEVVNVHALD